MRVLVTGASGFVGGHLCHALVEAGHKVTAALRRDGVEGLPADVRQRNVGDFGPDTDWLSVLDGVDTVVHTAARTHVLRETAPDAETAYHTINVAASTRLATQAASAGIGRFVYVSSVKAGGENSAPGKPLAATDPPAPEDAYGRTKLAGELALLDIARASSMRATVLRPPLVYGPGIKGNLVTLFRAIDKGLPLPLGTVNNRRSLVYVGNLIDAIVKTLDADTADGVFYVRDGEDVSTPDLIMSIAEALGRPARLWPFPERLLFALGKLTGRAETIKRVAGTLQIDDQPLRRELDWAPPFTMKEGLDRTAAWYKSQNGG